MMEERSRVKFHEDLPKRHKHHHRSGIVKHHPVYLARSPDGRKGMVIIICTYFVFVLTLGFKTALGVFYVEWEQYFDVTKTQVSWVTSLGPVVIGIVSPVAAALSHSIGPRVPVMFGGIVAATGLIASSYCQTIYHLLITIGIITAGGMGFAFGPSIVVLHHYFQKRFVIANGVAFAGIASGEVIWPLVLQPMIRAYGWQGALFLMSAIMLNLVVCGSVMVRPKARVAKDSKSEPFSIELDVMKPGGKDRGHNEDNWTSQFNGANRRLSTQSGLSVLSSISSYSSDSTTTFEPRPRLFTDPAKTFNLFMFGPAGEDDEDHPDEGRFKSGIGDEQAKSRKRRNSVLSDISLTFIHVMKKENFLLMRPMKYPFFVAMLPIVLFHGIGWFAVIAHLIPFAVAYGIPEHLAFDLLPFIGLGSILGCLTHGWFVDKNMVSSEFAKILSLAVLCIITFNYPAAHYSLEAMLSLSFVYGLAAGVSLPLFFALVRQLLPPEDINAGVSLVIISEMLGDTIGGVSAGLIYQLTHDYEMSFFFAGSAIAMATFLQMILSYLKRRNIINKSRSYTPTETSTKGFKEMVGIGTPVPNEFVIETEGDDSNHMSRASQVSVPNGTGTT